MRPSTWASVLMASAATHGVLAFGKDEGSESSPAIQFEPLNVQPEHFIETPVPDNIIITDVPTELSWNTSDTTTVDTVELRDSVVAFGRYKMNTKPQGSSPKVFHRDADAESEDWIPLTVVQDGSKFTLIFDNAIYANEIWKQNYHKPVYVNVIWFSDSGVPGYSSSKPFAIADSNPGSIDQAIAALQPPLNITAPIETTLMSTTAASTSTPTNSASVSSSATPVSGVSDNSTPSSGGLSTGAIAGIAVACGIVGLALIAGLAWFLCFRRRKQHGQAHAAGYGTDTGADAMIAEKEAPGVSESSPHSTYGDDGGRLHDRSSAAMDSSYMPYSDQAPENTHAATSSQTNLSHHAADSQPLPQASLTSYAHLVEEGMTDEEIRRLEEEERQLDQAIEAAGSNRATR